MSTPLPPSRSEADLSFPDPSEPLLSPPRSLSVLPGQAGELTGTIIRERYEVLGLLGRGGMADVYEARFLPAKNKRVALKMLRPSLSRNSAACKRFAHEFAILYEIGHKNLVVVHDYDRTAEGQFFMVLERLKGHSLDRLSGPLSPARMVVIAKQLGSVLEHLHQASVLHRDLKPANIILLDEPHQHEGTQRLDRIKLLDLGIARLQPGWYLDDRPYGTPPGERRLTKTGVVMGTPRYIPPEASYAPPTELWDIYSLGVLLWQLVCGRPPPNNWRIAGVMRAVPEGRFGLPTLMERMLREAMSVEPERRFPSATEFLLTLMEVEAELTDPGGVGRANPAKLELSTVECKPRSKDKAKDRAPPPQMQSPKAGPERLRWVIFGALMGTILGIVLSNIVMLQREVPEQPRAAALRSRTDGFGQKTITPMRANTNAGVADPAVIDLGTPPLAGAIEATAWKNDGEPASKRQSPKRVRSPIETANAWAHRHNPAIQRCFGGAQETKTLGAVDITLHMDALGRFKSFGDSQGMSSLRRRCLRRAFAKLDVGHKCANCALPLVLYPAAPAK